MLIHPVGGVCVDRQTEERGTEERVRQKRESETEIRWRRRPSLGIFCVFVFVCLCMCVCVCVHSLSGPVRAGQGVVV